jgi:hypothetical protein
VAPLWLGGLRGKQSTPSDWLGGTGEVSTVGERERHGARRRHSRTALRQMYRFIFYGFLGNKLQLIAIEKPHIMN